MKRDNDKPFVPGVSKDARKDPFFKDLPELLEALVDRFWDDGKPRTPWVMSVSFETGQAMVKLSDKAGQRTAQCIAPTVGECMSHLNEQIKNGTLVWRGWGQEKRR